MRLFVLLSLVCISCGGTIAGDPNNSKPSGSESTSALRPFGSISSSLKTDLNGVQHAAIRAVFTAEPIVPGFEESTWSCENQRPDGDCFVVDCTQNNATGQTASPGNIEVSDGTESIDLSFDTRTATYQGVFNNAFNGGLPLSVNAKGQDIPAFSGQITTPPALQLSPTPSTFRHVDGFSLHWTPVDADVAGYISQPNGATTVCRFKGSAGVGSISGSALANFQEGQAAMSWWTTKTTQVTAGNLYSIALTGTNGPIAQPLNVE
jgi:hypothetical protein